MELIAQKPITVDSVSNALFKEGQNPVRVWNALVQELGISEASTIWLSIFGAEDAAAT